MGLNISAGCSEFTTTAFCRSNEAIKKQDAGKCTVSATARAKTNFLPPGYYIKVCRRPHPRVVAATRNNSSTAVTQLFLAGCHDKNAPQPHVRVTAIIYCAAIAAAAAASAAPAPRTPKESISSRPITPSSHLSPPPALPLAGYARAPS